jgi:hypothetical protein
MFSQYVVLWLLLLDSNLMLNCGLSDAEKVREIGTEDVLPEIVADPATDGEPTM